MEPLLEAGCYVFGAAAAAFVYQQLYLHASLQMHKMQKMDESADETAATEKVSAAK